MAEIKILKLIKKKIIDMNYTPCIVEILYSKKCSKVVLPEGGVVAQAIINNSDIHDGYVKAKLAYNYIVLMAMEYCDITLQRYLMMITDNPINIVIIKSILFHVIFAIHITTQIWPGFRHGDLHASNIMLKINRGWKLNVSEPSYITYRDCGVDYAVPYFGIIPKIIDFDRARIPEKDIISSLSIGRFEEYEGPKHPMLQLFSGMATSIEWNKFPEITEILSALDPTHAYLEQVWGRMHKLSKHTPSVADMVKSPVWDSYRRVVPPGQVFHKCSELINDQKQTRQNV